MKRFYILIFFLLCGTALFSQSANSLDFDGSNDEVNCGNHSSIQITGTAITLEARVKINSFASAPYAGSIIVKEGSGQSGYLLRVGGNGIVNFNLGSGDWNELNTPENSVSLNTWHHIAATYDGSTQKIYVDGDLVDSRNMSLNIINASSADLMIGDSYSYSGRNIDAVIDEVRIWNTTRTQAELSGNMSSELILPQTGLVAYYKFNQGTANGNNSGQTTLKDEIGNSNGTLQSFALSGSSSNWVARTIANDTCTDAIALTSGDQFSDHPVVASNAGSTDSGLLTPDCAATDYGTGTTGDMWYTVSVPASGNITIETANNNDTITDTGLEVYSGTCTALSLIECNDDGGDNSFSKIDMIGRTAGETLYIRVWGTDNDVVGSVQVSAYESCYAPTALTATNITTTSADLAWTTIGSETAWNIEYGEAGFTQGSGTTVAATTNPYNLTGLTANTAYSFYVQADCGSSDTSAWAGPFDFSFVAMTGHIGIKTDEPKTALDIKGGLRAINRNQAGISYQCTAEVEGSMGYDTTDKKVKVCIDNNGNYEWKNLNYSE